MFGRTTSNSRRVPWNKGKLIGQKALLSMQDIWPIRIRLQNAGNSRETIRHVARLWIHSHLQHWALSPVSVHNAARRSGVPMSAQAPSYNEPAMRPASAAANMSGTRENRPGSQSANSSGL